MYSDAMTPASPVVAWLLEEDNPGVRLRTLQSLCGLPRNHPQVKATRQLVIDAFARADAEDWMERKILGPMYHLTALAESGLTRKDVPVKPVVDRLLALPFDAGCGDLMALRAMVMLGYGDDPRVRRRLAETARTRLPDGAWLCLHRRNKMNRLPKSCIKAAMHGLLLAGEMKKRDLAIDGTDELVRYFLKRRLFYRSDALAHLVIDGRPGVRMIDVFFPCEVMRVGLPHLLEAIAALGAGHSPEASEAWRLLDSKRDGTGKVRLDGTMFKSYLPKERVGRPSKWATLYAEMASRESGGRSASLTAVTS